MEKLAEIQRDRIREEPKPRTMYYLNLLTSIVQPVDYLPSDEEERKVLGDELATTLQFLLAHCALLIQKYDITDIMGREIKTDQDFQKLSDDIDGYIENNKIGIQFKEVMINLLKTWVEEHKKAVPFDKLKELHQEIMAAHDEKWIDQSNVTELWSNGEITSQKGGQLYGYRSVFSIAAPFRDNFDWTFAKTRCNESFVILESSAVAKQFRLKMAEILEKV